MKWDFIHTIHYPTTLVGRLLFWILVLSIIGGLLGIIGITFQFIDT